MTKLQSSRIIVGIVLTLSWIILSILLYGHIYKWFDIGLNTYWIDADWLDSFYSRRANHNRFFGQYVVALFNIQLIGLSITTLSFYWFTKALGFHHPEKVKLSVLFGRLALSVLGIYASMIVGRDTMRPIDHSSINSFIYSSFFGQSILLGMSMLFAWWFLRSTQDVFPTKRINLTQY